MKFGSYYIPPEKKYWQERSNVPAGACIFQHVQLCHLEQQSIPSSSDMAFAFLGVTEQKIADNLSGPNKIRNALSTLPLQKSMIRLYDVGNIIAEDHAKESHEALQRCITTLQKENVRPIVVGDSPNLTTDHFYGIVNGVEPDVRLGIIRFDAHLDLMKQSSATSFYQVAEKCKTKNRHFDLNCIGIQHTANVRQQFDAAKHFNAQIAFADDMHLGLKDKSIDFIDRVIDQNDVIYCSISMDVFSPAFAPGVAAIQPFGLEPWQVVPLLRQIAASNKVISYELSGYVPGYDKDSRTAKLAASLIYEIIHHHNEHQNIP